MKGGTRKKSKREEPPSAVRKRGSDGRFQAVRKPAAFEKPQDTNPAKDGEEKPLRPSQCRGHLRRELAKSFRGIVSGFVGQAEKGSVQHVKLATELLEEPPARKRGKGSAEVLLERLQRVKERGLAEADSAAGEDVWRD